MQQALTNALLMDAVVGSLQSNKAIYAASKLSHFDRIRTEGRVCVCVGGGYGKEDDDEDVDDDDDERDKDEEEKYDRDKDGRWAQL